MKMDEKTAQALSAAVDDVFNVIDEVTKKIDDIDVSEASSLIDDASSDANDAEKSAGYACSKADDAKEKLDDIASDITNLKEEVAEIGSKMRALLRALEPFLPKSPLEVLQKFCKDHRSTIRGMYLDNYVDRGEFNGIIISITRLSEMLGVPIDLDEVERRELEEIVRELIGVKE